MMNRTILAALLGLVAAFPAPATLAQSHQGVELVKADLIADTTAIAAGRPFTVGLRLVMAKDWHTYWKYSGDFGLPTEIEWQLPPGFTAGPIQWPVPERQVTGGDIITFGYEHEVLLMAKITPPANLSGAEVTLKAKASWLVCKESCVPGDAEVSLTLPVGTNGVAANAEIFAKYRNELPRTFDSSAGFAVTRTIGPKEITYQFSGLKPGEERTFDFYPLPPDASVVIGPPTVERGAGTALVRIPLQSESGKVTQFTGVAAVDRDNRRIGWELPANVPTAVPSATAPAKSSAPSKSAPPAAVAPAKPAGGLLYYLWLGFLGGLILNVMPCVLPVLSLKLFSFVRQAGEEKSRILRLGLTYCAGVFVWFMGIAILIAALGKGWGFHFQNPFFILGLSTVVFVFALNLMGVFEIILPGGMQNKLAGATSREGYGGAFFQGMLATVLATSCTAPVLGAALGFAIALPTAGILAMFAAIALGMCTPILLLSARPGWLKFLPKPGGWMERVKQIVGFLLMATVLWLLWILGQMLGSEGIIWSAAWFLALAMCAWLYGAFVTPVTPFSTQRRALIAIVVILVLGGFFTLRQFADSRKPAEIAETAPAAGENGIKWEKFTPARLDAAVADGKPVFIDFTADWCVNCKFNERTVLDTDEVRAALRLGGFLTLKGDYTRNDPAITEILKKFQRAGVPLYLVYPAGGGAPQVLPELLTKQIVLDALATAVPAKIDSQKITRADNPAGER